ncbi:unnamed protein product, partial [marine sediment metagenome]
YKKFRETNRLWHRPSFEKVNAWNVLMKIIANFVEMSTLTR